MTFALVTVFVGSALILRLCRPGPIPPRRVTWFDIPWEKQ